MQAKCKNVGPQEEQGKNMNEWGIAVKNGMYRVTINAGKGSATSYHKNAKGGSYRSPWYWDRGCSVEHARFAGTEQMFKPRPYTIEVDVRDGRLSLQGTSSGCRLCACAAVKSLQIQRIGDNMPGPWAPIAAVTEGAWWQMELDELTPIGLVSVATARLGSGLGQSMASNKALMQLDCRHWWLFTGRACMQLSHEDYQPQGRFTGGGVTTGAIVSVSNVSCVGEVCPTEGQHMCGSDEGTAGKSSFDRPAMSRDAAPYSYPQDNWCDKAVGKYVRVWLPGKDRIFDADVNVNRAKAKSQSELRQGIGQSGGECAVKTAHFNPSGGTEGGTLRNTKCNGLKNEMDDGACCDVTSSTVSNAVSRQVVCCADGNPFIPVCSSATKAMPGGGVNVGAGGLVMKGIDGGTPTAQDPRAYNIMGTWERAAQSTAGVGDLS